MLYEFCTVRSALRFIVKNFVWEQLAKYIFPPVSFSCISVIHGIKQMEGKGIKHVCRGVIFMITHKIRLRKEEKRAWAGWSSAKGGQTNGCCFWWHQRINEVVNFRDYCGNLRGVGCRLGCFKLSSHIVNVLNQKLYSEILQLRYYSNTGTSFEQVTFTLRIGHVMVKISPFTFSSMT